MNSKNKCIIEDLGYELRMLIGASEIAEALDSGNQVNYVKDSVYLHARNLYNFFSSSARYDAKVSQFTNHIFDLSFYDLWKDPLHRHVLHIMDSRTSPNNVINGEHINEQTKNFAEDIKKLWNDWIDNTTDPALKSELEHSLNQAIEEAGNDLDGLTAMFK